MKIPILHLCLLVVGCQGKDVSSPKTTLWSPRERVDIIFSGDFMQHLPQVNSARRANEFEYDSTLSQIVPFWKSADFVVINLETTLSDGPNYMGYPMFRSPRQIAQALSASGVTHCALANNHAMDAGFKGAQTTIRTLDSLGVDYFGVRLRQDCVSRVKYLKKGPFKVAVLNYTYGTNGMPVPAGVEINLIDTVLIRADIRQALIDSATHIITFFHWGDEYQRKSNKAQQELGWWCRSNGVDVVVGSHPHVVQEVDGKNRIVYSLGNFVSNQRQRYKNSGVSLRVTFYDGLEGSALGFLTHWVDDNYNIVLDNVQSNCDSRQALGL